MPRHEKREKALGAAFLFFFMCIDLIENVNAMRINGANTMR
jgi:hypothetical protein